MSNSTDRGRRGKNRRRTAALFASVLATSGFCLGSSAIGGEGDDDRDTGRRTDSPIKHVIILIGENRGFDHTFGTYKTKGEAIDVTRRFLEATLRPDAVSPASRSGPRKAKASARPGSRVAR